ncbi:hypothetical protein [Paenibacillus camelliae]|uniref:hypothetical protein n=1 Tax=Paenibacillus camelliae TaxID=512410 RepID=UPI00203AD159|nr:hypothetical protein [Paenibacillus camelliae]MCM3634438.1 hypothetical protein [Paenibacillus camelliae]
MKKTWKIVIASVIAFFLVSIIAAAIFINNIGYHNIKLITELNKNSNQILKMEKEGDYLTKANAQNERLIKKMMKEGWNFIDQEGAGYFFEKNGQETIITVKQMWSRHYVVYRVTHDAINLSE